jgi:hypothetical protein
MKYAKETIITQPPMRMPTTYLINLWDLAVYYGPIAWRLISLATSSV